MIVLVQATVLTIGIGSRNEVLRELPIRIVTMQGGAEAARSLKSEKIDSVISKWDLDDMENGRFLKKLKAIKPHIPTIAIIRPGDRMQEIAARSIGVSAVLTEDASDELFRETVANIFSLTESTSVASVLPGRNSKRTYVRVENS